MKLNVYEEECCDHCNETIHNHLDCPACGVKLARTDAYHSLQEDMAESGCADMGCECGARFQSLKQAGIAMQDWEWERTK